MFGIGGGELFFIILVVLMLFGSDKIPDIARALGKGMAQLKNATNEIKSEIQKGTQDAGLDMNTLTGGVSEEIAKAKEGITKMVNPMENINLDVQNPIEKVKEDIESITVLKGPGAAALFIMAAASGRRLAFDAAILARTGPFAAAGLAPF